MLKGKRRLGLRGKTVIFSAGMIVLLGAVLGSFSYLKLKDIHIQELEKRGMTWAISLARNAPFSLLIEDEESLTQLAASALSDREVLGVTIMGRDGEGENAGWKPMVRTGALDIQIPSNPDRENPAIVRMTNQKRSDYYLFTVPVWFEYKNRSSEWDTGDEGVLLGNTGKSEKKELLGFVHVGYSLQSMEASLAETLRAVLAVTLSVILIASLVLFYYLRRVVRPLEEMSEIASNMADGDFSRSFTSESSSDEVETLADSFTRMQESVRVHTEGLYKQRMEELSKANEETRQANLELSKVSRRKSAFLADMSHELRTPLNAVIGFAEIMNSERFGDLNPRYKRFSMNILNSGKHLLTIINDILDMAKIEAGRMELLPEVVNLQEVVEDVVRTIRGIAFKKGLDISLSFTQNTPTIVADQKKFKQVLYNLISNAVKYTPEGSVSVTLSQGKSGGKWTDENIHISIRDTGVGIPDDEWDRVFSEFDRIEDKYSREQEGTGLGLPLCKKLVELQGGDIGFSSVEAEGSDFWFTIPVRPPEVLPNRPGTNDDLEEEQTPTGETEPLPQFQDDAAPMEACIKELLKQAEQISAQRKIEFTSEIQEHLLKEMVEGETFKGVLATFLRNAFTHTEKGAVSLRITHLHHPARREGDSPGEYLKVAILDTGVGIARDRYDRVFGPPKGPAAVAPTEIPEMENGLPMGECKRRVESLGGSIGFESTVGRGSVFHFTLPLEPPQRKRDSEPNVTLTGNVPQNGARILVVEDDRASTEVLRVLLEEAGYTVDTAADAQAAIKMALDDPPDAVTLDIYLPGQDGWTVLQALRNNPRTRHVPVMVVSVLEHKRLGFSLGASAYLTKPVVREELLKSLGALTSKSRPRRVVAIDDDPMMLDYYKATLEQDKWEVLTASNGTDGIRAIHKVFPEVVLLDLVMDGMDGFDVLEELHHIKHYKDIPVVVVTAKDLKKTEMDRLKGKILTVMQKGQFTQADLLKDLDRLLETPSPGLDSP